MREELQRKVNFAIKLLQSAEKMAAKVNQPVEIAYSGGKDSDVILELAKMSGINYRAIYKCTTIDPAGTIKHAEDNGVEIMRPKETFAQLIWRKGFPSRRARFCCEALKEYKVLDYAVIGVRREESPKRAERYKEPEMCRVYSKKSKVRQYYPILEWTKEDIIEFIEERGIQCHPLYYDEDGTFHVERRLGCMGCPLMSHRLRIENFKQHPRMVRLYIRAEKKYWDSHPNLKIREYLNNGYEWFVLQVFCKSIQDFKERFGQTLFDKPIDCKKFLEDYFGVNLDFE